MSASERRQRDAEKAQKVRDANATYGFQDLVASRNGRAWLWKLLSVTSFYHDGFSPVPGETERNTGKRFVGLWIIDQIHNVDGEAYTLMRKENENPVLSAPGEEEGEE